MVIVIGGDGTHRGANVMLEEVARRKLKVCIAGVPKTIDNDIPLIDTSFGYLTSVGEATKAIEAAEVEAMSAEGGIGLVKLMGRSAGHIALGATLGNRCVNILLVKIYLVSTYNQNLGSRIQF
jgi:6-phosphofructokinase 1